MAFRKLIEMIRYFLTRRLRKETEDFLKDSVTRYNSFLVGLSDHYVFNKELNIKRKGDEHEHLAVALATFL